MNAVCSSAPGGAGTVDGELARGYARARRAVKQIGQLMRFGKAASHLYRGIALARGGRAAAARRALHVSLGWAQRLHLPYEEARARLELAALASADNGHSSRSDDEEHLVKARRLLAQMEVLWADRDAGSLVRGRGEGSTLLEPPR